MTPGLGEDAPGVRVVCLGSARLGKDLVPDVFEYQRVGESILHPSLAGLADQADITCYTTNLRFNNTSGNNLSIIRIYREFKIFQS